MVRRLTGKVQGRDIIFSRSEEGRWSATVPASPDGTYIIELWAEDEAGNTAYFATIKITFDPTQLCMAVSVLEVGAAFTVEEVLAALSERGAAMSVEADGYEWSIDQDLVISQVVRCERCGL